MTATPRTDAEQDDARNIALDFQCATPIKTGNVYVVDADFARALERELKQLQAWLNACIATKDRVAEDRDQWRAVAEQLAQELTDNLAPGLPSPALDEYEKLKQTKP